MSYMPTDQQRAAVVMAQMGAALYYLHSQLRIIHRDIKPENVSCCCSAGREVLMCAPADLVLF